ncbi:uncharacterized protein DUF397 [Micromonospora pisi]|uniref:Uncharacterized protein DUF397 n=1 Tax=Micromonospora pisi TaxID=589240 RepID=A0A495JLN4_9ACTN|nr:DUF397 domain-containing protein [Micromonospora pisi]RKR88949.1 uncharacterized protein DUF397 [Micromonospora pisi]
MSDLSAATWRKSSRSNNQGQCVEVADDLVGVVGVRDSKDVAGPVLMVGRAGWTAFVVGVKSGGFHR